MKRGKGRRRPQVRQAIACPARIRLNPAVADLGQIDMSWLTPTIRSAQARHRRRVEDLYAGRRTDRPVAICGPWFGRSHGLLGNDDIDMLARPEEWLTDVVSDMADNPPPPGGAE